MKLLSYLVIFISLTVSSLAGDGTTGGGGPKIDQNTKIIIDDLAGNNWTFNPDLIKNIQYNDGQIVGMGQLVPRTENVKVDMSDHYKLYEMGVDNIQMNSGEIILVEPQGFYIDQ